jgi:hypothetical protein
MQKGRRAINSLPGPVRCDTFGLVPDNFFHGANRRSDVEQFGNFSFA